MRRRRVPVQPTGAAEPRSDLVYLEHVVSLGYTAAEARTYLARHLANAVEMRLVEAGAGEAPGQVREVEIAHASGACSWVRRTGSTASQLTDRDVLRLHVPVRSMAGHLPEALHGPAAPGEETALERFLLLVQHLAHGVSEQIDAFPALTDPARADARFLPWLAGWVGLELDEGLPEPQQRELVRRALRLLRSRGTRAGIEEMVQVHTAAPARIEERQVPQPFVLGRSRIGGGRTLAERFERGEPTPAFLMPRDPSPARFFTLRLEPRGRFAERLGGRAPAVLQRIVEIVSAERPAHVHFVVRFDSSAR